MARSITDYRKTPFTQPPEFHFRQPFMHDPSFDNLNMVPTAPPPFFEFYDPVSGRHHKVDNDFRYKGPIYSPQTYSASFQLQDASPFPSTYEKKNPMIPFSAPHENSYARDNQFYTDFALQRQKSFQNNARFTGRNGFPDDFVIYLMRDWTDFKL